MATYPFIIELDATIAANGTTTLNYNVGPNEQIDVHEFRFDSTGTFGINDIRDNQGNHFTNATPTNPIPSINLQDAALSTIGIKQFPIPLTIKGSTALQIEVKDSSGSSNTVKFTLMCVRST